MKKCDGDATNRLGNNRQLNAGLLLLFYTVVSLLLLSYNIWLLPPLLIKGNLSLITKKMAEQKKRKKKKKHPLPFTPPTWPGRGIHKNQNRWIALARDHLKLAHSFLYKSSSRAASRLGSSWPGRGQYRTCCVMQAEQNPSWTKTNVAQRLSGGWSKRDSQKPWCAFENYRKLLCSQKQMEDEHCGGKSIVIIVN